LVFSAISFGGLAVSLFFYTGSTRVRIPVKPKLKKSLNFSQKLVVHAARARDRLIHDLALCQLRCAGLFISKWVGGFTGSGLFLIRVPHLNKNSRPPAEILLRTHKYFYEDRKVDIMPFLGQKFPPDQTLCDDSLLRDSANEDVSEQSLVLLKSTSCWSKTR